jgi:hypothetical protein
VTNLATASGKSRSFLVRATGGLQLTSASFNISTIRQSTDTIRSQYYVEPSTRSLSICPMWITNSHHGRSTCSDDSSSLPVPARDLR